MFFLAHALGASVYLLSNSLSLLGENHFHVGRLRHVRTDTSVGTVSAAASSRSPVGLDMGHNEVFDIHALGFGVSNSVLEHVEDNLGCLNRPPSTVSRSLGLLGLGVVTDSSGVLGERDSGPEREHITHEFLGLGGLHATDVMADLTAVFEVDAKVGATRLGNLALAIVKGSVRVLSHTLIERGGGKE